MIIYVILYIALQCYITTAQPIYTESLTIQNNKIYQSASNMIWAGKGVNLQDTRACGIGCQRSKDEVIRRVDHVFDNLNLDWVRLTLEADNTGQTVLNNSSYWQDIQDIVTHIGSKSGKYVQVTIFIDPYIGSDPNVPGGPSSNTVSEWMFMAETFKTQPHVMIGIVNEPRNTQATPGAAATLRNSMDYTVQKIRSTGAKNVIIVQCLDYSRDCSLYKENPIMDNNIAYEVHLYCNGSCADGLLIQICPSLYQRWLLSTNQTYLCQKI